MCPPTAGSFSLLRLRKNTSALKCCGLDLPRQSRLSCVRNRAHLLDFLSWQCYLRPSHASHLNFSACFFFTAFGFFCPCLLVPAGVAFVLGHHRAACSRACVLANRGFSVESAAARVCREAGARVNLFVRDLDLPVARHVVNDWKSWLTGFHSSMALSSPLTPHWSFLFVPTVSPGVSVFTWTVPLLPKTSSALIQSPRAIMAAPGWLFSQLKSEAVGQRRLVPS